ncbi:restriction endonuclease subunit S [Tepidimonas aquatica]|uniref:Type I restriction modification DNA specificity domain protein n=1 Tax=Tepidimonas aquatica TaxID=247482 RepID=A0A554WAJ5_9BURK|nr:restriction endonuclease subunit S [Tepidimonas aquatica]TSE20603.1 Type I restriction modification DNA specificity domain protein [Tepidimonas aquatica]
MAGEWVEVTVGELAPFAYGKGLPEIRRSATGNVPVYGSNGVVGFHDMPLTDGPTVVIGRKGTVGAVHYSPVPCWPIDTTFYVTGKDPSVLRYRYYLLKSLGLEHMNADSAVPGLNRDAAHARRIRIPLSEGEQRAIAHILGTLDDKIELNRRMSETLEAMARALFKAWFVDFEPVRAKMEGRWRRGETLPGLPAHLYDLFPDRLVDSELGEIPEGWGVGPLNDFFSVGLGGAWGEGEPSARATVAVRCLRGIDCHDLAEGRIPDVPVRWLSPKQVADRELMEGAILIEGSGSFCGRSMIWRRGYEALLGAPVGYSNFCKRLDPGCTPAQAAICWMQIRQAYRDGMLQSFRTGTAFPNFDVHGFLSNLIVVVPPVPLAEAFGKIFALSQRLDLMAQSRTLTALRDALLPRLISGELRVKDAETFLERVAA